MVDSGTRNERAICAVVRPATARKVSATCDGLLSDGWQHNSITASMSSRSTDPSLGPTVLRSFAAARRAALSSRRARPHRPHAAGRRAGATPPESARPSDRRAFPRWATGERRRGAPPAGPRPPRGRNGRSGARAHRAPCGAHARQTTSRPGSLTRRGHRPTSRVAARSRRPGGRTPQRSPRHARETRRRRGRTRRDAPWSPRRVPRWRRACRPPPAVDRRRPRIGERLADDQLVRRRYALHQLIEPRGPSRAALDGVEPAALVGEVSGGVTPPTWVGVDEDHILHGQLLCGGHRRASDDGDVGAAVGISTSCQRMSIQGDRFRRIRRPANVPQAARRHQP